MFSQGFPQVCEQVCEGLCIMIVQKHMFSQWFPQVCEKGCEVLSSVNTKPYAFIKASTGLRAGLRRLIVSARSKRWFFIRVPQVCEQVCAGLCYLVVQTFVIHKKANELANRFVNVYIIYSSLNLTRASIKVHIVCEGLLYLFIQKHVFL